MEPEIVNKNAESMTSERDFPWVPLVLVLLVALVLRLIQLDHAPHFDEFYHLLAANSLLSDGDLCIADCTRPYGRGALFTYLVAGSVGLFGSSLVAARLVSVAAGILLVGGVYWWLARVAGRTAAWVGGLLLALSPEAIFVSQFIRFYAWQALLIWIGGAALFFAIYPPVPTSLRSRVACTALATLVWVVAFSLQVTTLIAAAGVGIWLLIDPIAGWVVRRSRQNPLRVAIASIAVVALVVILGSGALQTDLTQTLLKRYRSGNLLMANLADDIRYYHSLLLNAYPTLYSLLPVAFLVALKVRPSAAKFCGAMFGVALVVHSGGSFKAPRFFTYAMPYFFALWGIALSATLPTLVSVTREAVAVWLGSDVRSRLTTVGSSALLSLALMGFLATNSAFNTTLKMVIVPDADWPISKPYFRGKPDWRPALEILSEWSQEADVLIASASVKSLYYLGRADAELSVSRMFIDPYFVPDFSRDPRVGVPVLKSVDAMSQLVNCYPSGLIIIEVFASGIQEWNVLPETLQFIATHTEELTVPVGSDLRVFRWRTDTQLTAEGCDPLPLSTGIAELATG